MSLSHILHKKDNIIHHVMWWLLYITYNIQDKYKVCTNYILRTLLLWIKTQSVKSRNNSCIGVTQENSIEFQVQSNLPYILIPMVCANYCVPYPKWPWVIHEANMWCPCCMTLLCSSSFYFILLSPMISLVTSPSSYDWCDSVTDQP